MVRFRFDRIHILDTARLRSRRRALLKLTAMQGAWLPATIRPSRAQTGFEFARVERDTELRFPRDHAPHPDFRTEWWYITGWLRPQTGGAQFGFQLTFFRAATTHPRDNPSAFAPTQLLLAHAALARSDQVRLIHEQAAGRVAPGLASFAPDRLALAVQRWRLTEEAPRRWRAQVDAPLLRFNLSFALDSAPLLRGELGYSSKGPASASHYYSVAPLPTSGELMWSNQRASVAGLAWLDHEWSSDLLDSNAIGWDWVGLLFDDGSTLMAFQIRRADGTAHWRDIDWRNADQTRRASTAVEFVTARAWRSARSGANYPVSTTLRIATGAAQIELTLEPLLDDQELDARASTGIIYWEGAVRVLRDGRPIGRGYLELTGYANAVRL